MKNTTRKNKTNSCKIVSMDRYSFNNIFTYNQQVGDYIIPQFNVLINGVLINAGTAIYRTSFTGGLNLFNYIGRDIAGTWNNNSRILTISGFY